MIECKAHKGLSIPFSVIPAVSGIIANAISAISNFMIDFCGLSKEKAHNRYY